MTGGPESGSDLEMETWKIFSWRKEHGGRHNLEEEQDVEMQTITHGLRQIRHPQDGSGRNLHAIAGGTQRLQQTRRISHRLSRNGTLQYFSEAANQHTQQTIHACRGMELMLEQWYCHHAGKTCTGLI